MSAIIGGRDIVFGGWGSYEIDRRRISNEYNAGDSPDVYYRDRSYIGAAEVVKSVVPPSVDLVDAANYLRDAIADYDASLITNFKNNGFATMLPFTVEDIDNLIVDIEQQQFNPAAMRQIYDLISSALPSDYNLRQTTAPAQMPTKIATSAESIAALETITKDYVTKYEQMQAQLATLFIESAKIICDSKSSGLLQPRTQIIERDTVVATISQLEGKYSRFSGAVFPNGDRSINGTIYGVWLSDVPFVLGPYQLGFVAAAKTQYAWFYFEDATASYLLRHVGDAAKMPNIWDWFNSQAVVTHETYNEFLIDSCGFEMFFEESAPFEIDRKQLVIERAAETTTVRATALTLPSDPTLITIHDNKVEEVANCWKGLPPPFVLHATLPTPDQLIEFIEFATYGLSRVIILPGVIVCEPSVFLLTQYVANKCSVIDFINHFKYTSYQRLSDLGFILDGTANLH